MSQAVSSVWQPSTARAVALDGYFPLPRGVVPSDLPPPSWPAKDPVDVLDYEVDASAVIAGDPTDQVATVAVAIIPQNSVADVQVGRVLAKGAVAVIWLSSGQAGTVYSIQITIGTLKGRVIGRTVLLPVQALATQAPPTSSLLAEDGSVITDHNGNPVLLGG